MPQRLPGEVRSSLPDTPRSGTGRSVFGTVTASFGRKGTVVRRRHQGRRHSIHAEAPKVYLPVGNCLLGHIDGPDAMALAFRNSAGVCQMMGYTEPTWYGYGGWGMLDYSLEQPGRFAVAEAFYANQQAMVHRLQAAFPGLDAAESPGDSTALAGDLARNGAPGGPDLERCSRAALSTATRWPSTEIRPGQREWAAGPVAWDQELAEANGEFSFHVKPRRGEHPSNRSTRAGLRSGADAHFPIPAAPDSGVERADQGRSGHCSH